MNIKQARQLLYWFAYTIIAPVGFVAVVWLVAKLGQVIPRGSFGEVFGTGDLLPLAALLLLSSSADIRMAGDDMVGILMTVCEVAFVMMGLAAIVVYGVFKMRGLELLSSQESDAKGALAAFAWFSWAYIAAAIVLTVPVKWKLVAASPHGAGANPHA